MNLPAAMAGLAAGALQPAFGGPVDVAGEEVPALAAVLGGVGLRQWGHRAARTGLGIFPVLAGVLVALAQDVGGGVAGEGEIALGWRGVLDMRDRSGDLAVFHLGERPSRPRTEIAAREAAAASAQSDENHRHEQAGGPDHQ